MGWDSSRIAAAIPSGGGFLGAGLIFKEAQKDELTGMQQHVVHGLTTATSVWLSAAVGCACGGALYFVASFATAIMLLLLRFGPRQHDNDDDDEEEQDNEEGRMPFSIKIAKGGSYGALSLPEQVEEGTDRENDPMLRKERDGSIFGSDRDARNSLQKSDPRNKSVRKRAALGSVV